MSKKRQERLFWGVVLILIGSLFMLRSLGVDIDLWHTLGKLWPAILIIIGLKIIWSNYQLKGKEEEEQ
jgi:predicted tellurium resistance membrane protein TerC